MPYFILLFIIGLPIVLLEVSLGQFLGQGSAHTWRASPVFKGKSQQLFLLSISHTIDIFKIIFQVRVL